MRYPGVTVFILFFGIALLEALTHGHWLKVAFWLGMGLLFVGMEWFSYRRRIQ